LANDLGVRGSTKVDEAIVGATSLILCLKPHLICAELERISGFLREQEDRPLIVSFAAGLSYDELKNSVEVGSGASADESWRLARVMPNLAMSVGEGVSGVFSKNPQAAVNANDLMSLVGKACILHSETDFASITGLSGSGPAFVFEFIRAMRNAGDNLGLGKELSNSIAAQTVLGAAQLALESDKPLEQLIENVVTPGGTTAKGLEVLEEKGFADGVQSAVKAAAKRAGEALATKTGK